MGTQATPGPGLFAILPEEIDGARAGDCLLAFAEVAPVASLLMPRSLAGTQAGEEPAALARQLGLALLVADDARMARAVQADGVHLGGAAPGMVRKLRRAVGDDLVIGACCPTLRHEAMELGEAGADYLMIDQRLEAAGENLLAWWAEMFTVPVVAAQPVEPEAARAVLALGADFLVPSMEMWRDAAMARKLGERYARVLAEGGSNNALERNEG